MTASAIRQRLHQFIESVEEKKIKAIYTIFEDEITRDEWTYTDKFKAELESRYNYYRKGGKMVSPTRADKEISDMLNKGRKK